MTLSPIQEGVLRARLANLTAEIRALDEARAWAAGTWSPAPGEILPHPVGQEATAAWHRALRRVAAIGPRIVSTLVGGVVGSVTWGGESRRVDRALETLDLAWLARALTEDLLVQGVAAGYVYEREDSTPRIGRITGYLQPITDSRDADILTALYQVQSYLDVGRGLRYWVRWWDLGSATVQEWRDLPDPTSFSTRPPSQELVGLQPRYRVWALDPDGTPQSLILWALPMLRDIMASELMLARAEELAGYPVPIFGPDTDVQAVGPGLPIRGQFAWAQPGNLGELREQLRLKLERLRDALSLPGAIMGAQPPSGEALKEANLRFRQMTGLIRNLVEGLMTELVADYAAAVGAEPVPVAVLPPRDLEAADRIQVVAALYRDGLIPLRVAAREIQPYLPTWSDEELSEWLERQESIITPSQLPGLLGGGGE